MHASLQKRKQPHSWVWHFVAAFFLFAAASIVHYAYVWVIEFRGGSDYIRTLGWPFVFFEEGGMSWRRKFYGKPLAADIALGLVISAVVAFGFHRRRQIPHFAKSSLSFLFEWSSTVWKKFRSSSLHQIL